MLLAWREVNTTRLWGLRTLRPSALRLTPMETAPRLG